MALCNIFLKKIQESLKSPKIVTKIAENRQKIASRQGKILSPRGSQSRLFGDKSPFLVTLGDSFFFSGVFPLALLSHPDLTSLGGGVVAESESMLLLIVAAGVVAVVILPVGEKGDLSEAEVELMKVFFLRVWENIDLPLRLFFSFLLGDDEGTLAFFGPSSLNP